ncbi:MAG: protein kinase [Deltaproteobacteria bacterium]|nr:protein kinase [Deltaproteobacteria bacterium]
MSASSAQQDPLVGRTVGGSYTLQELIGVGGMGRVYLAEQTALGRTVAVKVIHPHLLGDEQTVARFYVEARASSRLNHPNSVSIIDFGRTDDGVLYLVMEHLKGKDLALVMHEEGPLPFDQIADALTGALGALGEAHALGVVHRDLKPENIIIKRFRSGGDLVKVVDFGLATIASGHGGTSITSPGLVCGTPDYMSPEQGRGEAVDGRTDLYALGVVLFELLTDQLPFEDETPTKVVLRHINDPVPNPAEAAPERGISAAFVDVTMKALAKSPADRFQSADEMARAIRDAAIEATRVTPEQVQCGTCSEPNPTTMRFCGSCGARLNGGLPAVAEESKRPSSPARTPSFYPTRESTRPFVGRDAEVERLLALRAEAMSKPVWVHLSGEPGVGKTRLLEEVARRAEEAGDLVVGAGPHPTRAPVPYAAIRTLMAALLSVDESELSRLASSDGVFSEPIMRAGVSEVVEPNGLVGFEDQGRAGAVTAALATAVKVAASTVESGRVTLFVDGLPYTDGLTRRVLADLPRQLAGMPFLLVTAGYQSRLGMGTPEVVELVGLDAATAAAFMNRPDSSSEAAQFAPDRRFLPLYLEQVEALGATLDEEALPVRLADALAQRLDRLSLEARRVIQATSVIGESCSLEYLRRLVDPQDFSGLESVTEADLLRLDDGNVVFTHPFVRDIVEGSIPAEARRDLHTRALHLATEFEEPLEVRAEHAFRAGEPMSALMLLERMGDSALRRSDATAAVLAFQRALALGRREMLETGDIMLEGAIVTFSRKLGGALERGGDVAGADGVLREALDLAGPASAERVRMLLVLGRVAARRDRRRDAVRLLGQALELAENQKDRDMEATVQVAIARVRRVDGDSEGAQTAYGRAALLEKEIGATPERRTRTVVELAEVLTQDGELETALERAREARSLAAKAGAPALTALALGTLGVVEHHRRNRDEASSLYHDAARSAAEAGDGPAHERWKAAARSLSSATL